MMEYMYVHALLLVWIISHGYTLDNTSYYTKSNQKEEKNIMNYIPVCLF